MEAFSREYLDDILVRLAHHSSSMEGNTISLADTISIILHDTIPGSPSKREFYEIENHKGAFEYILAAIDGDEELSTALICGIHQKLTDRLQYDSGKFKASENVILGADFETASPHQVPTLMYQWAGNLNYRLGTATTDKEKVEAITEAHINFEKIHPFSDGNGRTGRMLIVYSLLKAGLPPLIIDKQLKAEYIRFLNGEDAVGFSNFAMGILDKEAVRAKRFMNKESVQIKVD